MASETIIKAFALLHANWPRYEYSAETVRLYERCLADLPTEVLEAAVVRCLTECTFFPTVAEVRSRAVDLLTAQSQEATALEAWGEVKQMLKYPAKERRWSNEAIPRAMTLLGGMHAYGMAPVDDEPSWRARFCEAYDAIRERERAAVGMLPEVRALAERLRLERPRPTPRLEAAR